MAFLVKPPRESEKLVQRNIVVRLRRLGILLFRRNVAGMKVKDDHGERFIRFERAGRSDLYGWHIETGQHYEIEVKADGEKPTPKQLEWLKEATRLGAVAFWSDSSNDAERVAEAVLAGGRIVWPDHGDNFYVEM